MSRHATPFYCPYCGEEDIRPFGERHGEWTCGSCRQAWSLRGLVAREPSADTGPPAPRTTNLEGVS